MLLKRASRGVLGSCYDVMAVHTTDCGFRTDTAITARGLASMHIIML